MAGQEPRLKDGVSMRPTPVGEEDTLKPIKGKKRKKDATVLTSTAIASPLTENEGDDDDGVCPLVQGARRGEDAPQDTGREAAESGAADLDQTRAEETLEEGSGGSETVPESQVRHGTVRANEPAASDSKGPEPEASCGQDEALKEINTLSGLNLGLEFPPGGDQGCSGSAYRWLRRYMTMPSLCSKASFHAIGQKDAAMGRLQEEATAKDAEIIVPRGQNEGVASERDNLRSKLASTRGLLQSAQKEAAALFAAKSEAEEDTSSYKKDTATANERAREILKKAKHKLDRAVAYARAEARRQAFEEVSAKGTDLSAEIEEALDLEEKLAFSATSDEGSGDDLESSDGEE
ncbi:PREDICTED: uncharacterized protein LOC109230059 [Nicotiana attenuata]|uniref:uncharacterized protein LOC109230059 n=1 Tax=Nicotiana attenuata TaxID=49451 RepID=UPI0009059D3B|nr:PREDICTED: uncharacterized protein LOC109230059 [Nicotiana attenuata]